MAVAWRIAKMRYPVYDGTGAFRVGARWSSPGRSVVYASDTFAGAILEVLAHAVRPRTLPGLHHAVRLDFPEDIAEVLEPAALPGWELKGSTAAWQFGDRWFDERRTAVLLVPAVPSRPIGRSVVINPAHPDAARIVVSASFRVPWDERLF